jgi:hypothetical protein
MGGHAVGVDIRRLPVNPPKAAAGAVKIENPLEIDRLLTSASENGARVDLLFPWNSLRFVTRAHLDYAKEQGFRMVLPPALNAETLLSSECNAIIFLKGQVLVCVRAMNAMIELDSIVLREPWTVFSIQRRKEPRYIIQGAYEYMATLDSIEGPKRRVQKRLLDVSCSGFSIQAASSREAALFRKGLMMKRISFRIEERLIVVDAQVCSSVPLGKETGLAGVKIGLKILRIGTDDRIALISWVARQLTLAYV